MCPLSNLKVFGNAHRNFSPSHPTNYYNNSRNILQEHDMEYIEIDIQSFQND